VGAATTIRAGPLAGIVAATVLASMPEHIESSRFATTDVPSAAAAALTLLLVVLAMRGNRKRWLVLAGIAAGLAGGVKYNAASLVVIPVVMALMPRGDPRAGWRQRVWTALLVVAACVVTLVATTPALLFDFAGVREYLELQAVIYGTVYPGATQAAVQAYLAALTGPAVGLPMFVLGSLGLVYVVARAGWVGAPLAVYPLFYLIMISIPARAFDRNLLPILPFLAFGAGILIAEVASQVVRLRMRPRSVPGQLASALLAVVVTAPLVLPPNVAAFNEGRMLKRADTRTIALGWVRENLPAGTHVAREWYTPPTAPPEYSTELYNFLARRPLDWYREAGVQYLIASEAAYGRFFQGPTNGQRAFYEQVFRLPEVYQFKSSPDRPGPTIRIFKLSADQAE
jgi:4-amino-4-deoxy-L-arabinose transferase-like glycosyltransferase